SSADEFYSQYNGKVFNSIDNQPCVLKYVAFVEGEMPQFKKFCTKCSGKLDDAGDIYIELLCSHTFHASCLPLKESCPECGIFKPLEVELSKCFTCTNQESLYLCLNCGDVGCPLHATKHFETTQHMYALQVGGNKVWNYARRNFLYLLPKDGGKFLTLKEVDLSIQLSLQKAYYEDRLSRIQEEFMHSINQYESQKPNYEERISRIEQEALSQRLESESRHKQTVEECEQYKIQVQNLLKEKSTLEKKNSQTISKLQKELSGEKEMNNGLRSNQKSLKDKVSTLESSREAESEKHKKFMHSINHQYESQKANYEERISRIEQEALSQRLESESRHEQKVEECEQHKNQVQNLLKEKSTLEKKNCKLQKELSEEKEMNNGLRSNQKSLKDKVSTLESSREAESEKHKK
ncbi:BRCA1-associated protein-like, partial [Anneissia japonica]|uniref:BRCA1-associated protein-like n=1 Tax=Anneissia japonica TaxID=1529436 RepID=UPI001425AD31